MLDKVDRLIAGQAIRKLRKVFDIESKALAKQIGVSRPELLAFENENDMRAFPEERIEAIAKIFGLSVRELVKIGLHCNSTLDTFKYLQRKGKI